MNNSVFFIFVIVQLSTIVAAGFLLSKTNNLFTVQNEKIICSNNTICSSLICEIKLINRRVQEYNLICVLKHPVDDVFVSFFREFMV